MLLSLSAKRKLKVIKKNEPNKPTMTTILPKSKGLFFLLYDRSLWKQKSKEEEQDYYFQIQVCF